MDEINQRLIEALSKNARLSLTELSQFVSLSVPAVRERVQKLVTDGIIQRFTIELDYELLGKSIHALVMVRLVNGLPETIENFLKQVELEPDVTACSTITGDFEYILSVRTSSMTELEALLARLRSFGVGRTNTSFLLSKKK